LIFLYARKTKKLWYSHTLFLSLSPTLLLLAASGKLRGTPLEPCKKENATLGASASCWKRSSKRLGFFYRDFTLNCHRSPSKHFPKEKSLLRHCHKSAQSPNVEEQDYTVKMIHSPSGGKMEPKKTYVFSGDNI
jgi:hypothetical protein